VTTTAAAIYCRISNDADGRMLGVTRQERSCRRLAAQRGLDVARVFVDNDISAFSGARRPAYQQLLAELAEGAFGVVIAWDGDRLHRSTRELEDFLDVIETTGAIVLTVTSGEIDLVTATGRMQARIKGDISRYESEHKTERTMAAHAYLAEAGRWKGGPRPYGYDVDRDNHGRPLRDGRLVIIPAEAAIVTEAAARVLAGESTYAICNDLNDRHIPTAQNGQWRTQTLRRILTNPTTAAKRT
jgi:site-specific DNA recombinase